MKVRPRFRAMSRDVAQVVRERLAPPFFRVSGGAPGLRERAAFLPLGPFGPRGGKAAFSLRPVLTPQRGCLTKLSTTEWVASTGIRRTPPYPP